MTILHIEDTPHITKLVELACKSSFEVDSAETLEEAHYHLRFRKYDLLLVDLKLPDSEGAETVKSLLPYGIPIVVLTGNPSEALLKEVVNMGASDYLLKTEVSRINLPLRLKFVVEKSQRERGIHSKRKIISFTGFSELKPYLTCAALA